MKKGKKKKKSGDIKIQNSRGTRPSLAITSIGWSGWRGAYPDLDLEPLRHMTADRKREKDSRHRSHPMVML